MKPVTKAIICAAGQGTRFLPMTKAMPKEMLPIIDKPIIQYVVEEAVAAGITDVIIVGNANKQSIEDHFDHQPELEQALRAKGKDELADRMRAVGDMANFIYLRQKGAPGNGTPVLNAAHLLDDEPYLVLFADDFFRSDVPRAVQLKEAHERTGKSVITLIEVEKERAKNYGISKIRTDLGNGTFELEGLVEKPEPGETPLHNGRVYAAVGGYILTPDFMQYLQTQTPGKGNEIVLADAINRLAHDDKVYGQYVQGQWHDAGDKEKYLEAIVDVALASPELGGKFKQYLQDKIR